MEKHNDKSMAENAKGRDQKSEHQQAERNHGKAQETKPNLQEGDAIPGQKAMPAQRPGNTK